MSGIFYTREPGADGQILSGEGVAPGVGLDLLLERDRPPLRAALEIGSAVADILCIAAEDKSVHGDIRPAHVKVDEAGAVSIEGYGIVRRVTRAPEGRPDQLPADIYGLGLVMHASLSSEGLGNLPNDADGHDDAVVERVLGMDFSAVSTKRWLAEVREFLCKILAFDPAERPPALDAANVLASVAGQCPGDDIAVWAQRAHLRLAGGRPPARQVEENLAGPVSLTGYFKKGDAQKESARKAPSTKGESTAMWSREKLAAMFAEEDEDEPVARAPAKPAPKGESLAPARPVAQAMPPAPPKVPPAAPPTASPTIAPYQAETWNPAKLNTSVDRATDVGPVPASPPPKPPAKPQVVQPSRGIQAGNAISAAPPREPEEAEPKKGPNVMLIVGVVSLLAVLLCAGVGLLGGGGYFFMSQPGTATTSGPTEKPADVPAKTDAPAKPEASAGDPAATLAGGPAPAAEAAPAATPSPAAAPASTAPAATTAPAAAPAPAATTKPATATSTAPAATTTKPAATSTTKPAATAAPAATTTKPAATSTAAPTSTATSTTTYPVKFTSPGREGKVRCGDGQTAEFSGATTLNFSGTVTCLVQIGQGRGAVQVSRSSTVTCSEDSGKVSCSGGS